ncbi:hypothetical protein ACJIZ3_011832 [Penstemon smallii]|uniref:BHLH domain-containing protein n=1 Tax=Penstemon smallii TaxID=265156 RepID=A0ABD3UKM3_9LAMI
MGSQLQHVLRSLCFNTGWKYSVFWKLKQRTRMMITWEDAYYDNNQYSERKCMNEASGSLHDGLYAHDPLGLAVAKMSYQVFALGEGIVGQVAVSGNYSWICSDMHVSDSEYFRGWQNQFSAGIKTIAVVAVIPHGVIQLGSLHKIAEDLKLVNHIRNVFSELQDYSAGFISSSMQSYTENSCLSDMCTPISDSDGFHGSVAKFDRTSFHEDEMYLWSQLFSSLGKSSNHSGNFSPPGVLSNKIVKTNMPEKDECSISGNEISLPSSSEKIPTRQQHQEDLKYGGQLNDLSDLGKRPEIINIPSVKNIRSDKSCSCNATLPTDDSQNVTSHALLDSPAFQDQGAPHVPEIPSFQSHQDFEKNLEIQIKSNRVQTQILPFSFGAGYELYEALGTSFRNQSDCVWEAERSGSDMAIEISEGMGSSSLLMENSDMHLLDAVVAKVSQKEDDTKGAKSCRDTEESFLTAEKTPCTSVGNVSSAGYSFDRDTSSSFNSVKCGVESFKGFSSTSSSKGSEQIKVNKKRARPGESSRPRPRDRQLIQDRIKELRELVPNGSKCSIDSLLERTIKHMIFLQSTTKHAEKLQKCSASKLLDKETGMRRFSSREQGSSWAVEVGNNSKVCPIIVENINMNGQMLVEILCEEYNQFLDVAETIRSLGLTILKGVSEAYGNKTWNCFVVEGQNNRNMHRMDVLWSLMQLLQPKIAS